jgi:hypothetical protein
MKMECVEEDKHRMVSGNKGSPQIAENYIIPCPKPSAPAAPAAASAAAASSASSSAPSRRKHASTGGPRPQSAASPRIVNPPGFDRGPLIAALPRPVTRVATADQIRPQSILSVAPARAPVAPAPRKAAPVRMLQQQADVQNPLATSVNVRGTPRREAAEASTQASATIAARQQRDDRIDEEEQMRQDGTLREQQPPSRSSSSSSPQPARRYKTTPDNSVDLTLPPKRRGRHEPDSAFDDDID